MADEKISGLTAVGALTGSEELAAVQTTTKKVTVDELSAFTLDAGLTGTYNFGGGSSDDIASMTFVDGILTAITTVP